MPCLEIPRRTPRLPFAAVLLLGLPSALAAQETVRPADAAAAIGASAEVSSFRGISFGASAEEVRQVFGDPVEERRLENGLQILAYRGELVGRPSLIFFGLLDDDGLVKGDEVVDLAGEEECIEQVRDIHHRIDLRYPLIHPAEQARNNSPDPICAAAPAGQAYWHRQWRDESTGAVITVSVASGSDEIDVIYESRAFREWAAQSGAGTGAIENEGAPPEVLEKKQ
jgi:hypothetical protein